MKKLLLIFTFLTSCIYFNVPCALGAISAIPIDSTAGLKVEITNYSKAENVLKYNKLEIGIELPHLLARKVNNFVRGQYNQNMINPYLEWELRVYAEFLHPDAQNSIVVDGFYYKEFDPWMVSQLPEPRNKVGYSDDEYRALGGYQEKETELPFRVRFSPGSTGTWKYRIHIVTNDSHITSSYQDFTVVESENKGFVSIGANKRYLSANGRTFFPVGCNMPWPQTNPEFDLEFAKKNITTYDGQFLQEQYRDAFVLPRVYEKYRGVLNHLADSGVNLVRTIMYPSSTEIEFEQLGNYTNRLHMAQEIDQIVELAEKREVYLSFVMQSHYVYQKSSHAYFTRWTWDHAPNGHYLAYKSLMKNDDPVDFFTNPNAKKYYKQRLRYIVARWGYSTSIAFFELFSEINNVGASSNDISDFYIKDDNWKVYRNWQVEMGEFIKSQYNGRVHLLTASFAGPKHPDDDIYAFANFDLMTSNIYDVGDPSFSDGFWNDMVAERFLDEECGSADSYTIHCSGPADPDPLYIKKPLIFAETGMLDIDGRCQGKNVVELRRLLWESAFSGLAGVLPWSAWYDPNVYGTFKEINTFLSKYNLDGEFWHPGASDLTDENLKWIYNGKYASGMEGSTSDLAYLRSGDKSMAIGVITNKTYNVYNTSDCYDEIWSSQSKGIDKQQIAHTKKDRLKIRGMNRGAFVVEYYSTRNLNTPLSRQKERGTTIKIDYDLIPSEEGFIILVVVKSRNQ